MLLSNLVRAMHNKFGINHTGPVRELDSTEKAFRVAAMQEELNEYDNASDLEEEFDALIDLMVFATGTLERQGMLHILPEGIKRVMAANMNKTITGEGNAKRGGFAIDLVKPEDWKAPDHSDLIAHSGKPTGIILLEGPDASGKSTLAAHYQYEYGAEVIHSTWSPELEVNMDTYIMGTLVRALELSKTKLVILDRLWMSELIYSKVFRQGTQFPDLHQQCVELLEVAVTIVCLPERHKWQQTFVQCCEQRDEMYMGKVGEMTQVYNHYEKLFDGGTVKGLPSLGDFADEIVEQGGLQSNYSFVRYNMHEHGIDFFTAFALKRLYELK